MWSVSALHGVLDVCVSRPRTSESEVEEDCDLWVDGAGRQWMRTAAFLGRWDEPG